MDSSATPGTSNRNSPRLAQAGTRNYSVVDDMDDQPGPENGENEEYEISDLVDRRIVVITSTQGDKKEHLEYLVKWKGYDENRNTWESVDNFSDMDLVQVFERRLENEGPSFIPGKRGRGKWKPLPLKWKRRITELARVKRKQQVQPEVLDLTGDDSDLETLPAVGEAIDDDQITLFEAEMDIDLATEAEMVEPAGEMPLEDEEDDQVLDLSVQREEEICVNENEVQQLDEEDDQVLDLSVQREEICVNENEVQQLDEEDNQVPDLAVHREEEIRVDVNAGQHNDEDQDEIEPNDGESIHSIKDQLDEIESNDNTESDHSEDEQSDDGESDDGSEDLDENGESIHSDDEGESDDDLDENEESIHSDDDVDFEDWRLLISPPPPPSPPALPLQPPLPPPRSPSPLVLGVPDTTGADILLSRPASPDSLDYVPPLFRGRLIQTMRSPLINSEDIHSNEMATRQYTALQTNDDGVSTTTADLSTGVTAPTNFASLSNDSTRASTTLNTSRSTTTTASSAANVRSPTTTSTTNVRPSTATSSAGSSTTTSAINAGTPLALSTTNDGSFLAASATNVGPFTTVSTTAHAVAPPANSAKNAEASNDSSATSVESSATSSTTNNGLPPTSSTKNVEPSTDSSTSSVESPTAFSATDSGLSITTTTDAVASPASSVTDAGPSASVSNLLNSNATTSTNTDTTLPTSINGPSTSCSDSSLSNNLNHDSDEDLLCLGNFTGTIDKQKKPLSRKGKNKPLHRIFVRTMRVAVGSSKRNAPPEFVDLSDSINPKRSSVAITPCTDSVNADKRCTESLSNADCSTNAFDDDSRSTESFNMLAYHFSDSNILPSRSTDSDIVLLSRSTDSDIVLPSRSTDSSIVLSSPGTKTHTVIPSCSTDSNTVLPCRSSDSDIIPSCRSTDSNVVHPPHSTDSSIVLSSPSTDSSIVLSSPSTDSSIVLPPHSTDSNVVVTPRSTDSNMILPYRSSGSTAILPCRSTDSNVIVPHCSTDSGSNSDGSALTGTTAPTQNTLPHSLPGNMLLVGNQLFSQVHPYTPLAFPQFTFPFVMPVHLQPPTHFQIQQGGLLPTPPLPSQAWNHPPPNISFPARARTNFTRRNVGNGFSTNGKYLNRWSSN